MIEEYLGAQSSVEEAVAKLRQGVRLIKFPYVYELRRERGLDEGEFEAVFGFTHDDERKFYTTWSLEDWMYEMDEYVNEAAYVLDPKQARKALRDGRAVASAYRVFFVGRVESTLDLAENDRFVFSVHRCHLRGKEKWQSYIEVEDLLKDFSFRDGTEYMYWPR